MKLQPFLESIIRSAQLVSVIHRHSDDHPFLNVVHAHDDVYQMCYMVNGESRVLLGSEPHLMRSGDAFVISPGVSHGPAPDERLQPTETLHLKFKLRSRIPWQPLRVIRVDSMMEFETIFHDLLDEYNLHRPLRDSMLRGYLVQLLVMLARSAIATHSPAQLQRHAKNWPKIRGERKARNVAAWIARHYAEPVTLPQLADVAGMSVSALCATFKTSTGLSPMRYLLNYRLSKAAQFMWHTDFKLATIATSVGFSSASHMSRSFKQHFGCAPRKYIESTENKNR